MYSCAKHPGYRRNETSCEELCGELLLLCRSALVWSLHLIIIHLLCSRSFTMWFLVFTMLSTVATVTQNVSNAVFAKDCFQLWARREAVGRGEMLFELQVAKFVLQLDVRHENQSLLKHVETRLGHQNKV